MRVGSYRAVALKRERAKYVWAGCATSGRTFADWRTKVIRRFFPGSPIWPRRQILRATARTLKLNDAALAEPDSGANAAPLGKQVDS